MLMSNAEFIEHLLDTGYRYVNGHYRHPKNEDSYEVRKQLYIHYDEFGNIIDTVEFE